MDIVRIRHNELSAALQELMRPTTDVTVYVAVASARLDDANIVVDAANERRAWRVSINAGNGLLPVTNIVNIAATTTREFDNSMEEDISQALLSTSGWIVLTINNSQITQITTTPALPAGHI